MRQCGVELFLLDEALCFFKFAACVKPKYPLTIVRDVQIFFPGLMLLRADRTSWITLLDFSGVNAIISLAAATTIQKIADSKMAITLDHLTIYLL